MPDVVMPRLSDSMEEGTVLRWLKASGDVVSRGEELAEIETDKATMTYEADSDGVLELVAAEGETLPIGAVIARIGGEAGARAPAAAAAPGEPPAAAAAPAEPPAPVPAVAAARPAAGPRAPAPAPGAPALRADGARVKASPVARRVAGELGVDLGGLAGTGPGGRIVRADVEAAANGAGRTAPPAAPAGAPAAPAAAAPDAGPPGLATAKGQATVQELSRVQQTVARRMAESRATVPDFTLTAEIDMQAAADFRAQLKAAVPEAEPVPSFNDLIVKACALALREHPRANAAYKDGRFELYERVNVGVAVAGQDSLVVPTIFDADRKGLAAIAAETRALAGKARDGTVTPPELSGGTFTVSNLGMFGIRQFTAVISPPQAAILAVGAIEPRPVVRDGQALPGLTMALTLACDHRILYGADAAEFLAAIRTRLQAPASLSL